jgi:protein involved in polysaccharide export with SLBB domain
LQDSDLITVFSIGDLRRDRVVVTGEVQQPGIYQWRPGLTVAGLVEQANGTLPWALTDRLKLFRPVVQTGRNEIVNLNLADSAARNFPVFEFDSLVVLDGRLLFPSGSIQVTGAVNRPGTQSYVEGQSLRDVLDLVGGIREDAASVEVARRVRRDGFTDTTAVVTQFSVSPAFLDGPARAFIIERGDVVAIRAKPGFRTPGTVVLEGEFHMPGTYAIRQDGERVSEVVARAGGILPGANPEAFRLQRNGRLVSVDLTRSLRGDRREDVVLFPGDLLRLPRAATTVSVTGAVRRELIIPYNPRWGMGDYLSAAGGFTANADKGAVLIEYQSGLFNRVRRVFGLTLSHPPVRPGAIISVGTKPAGENAWREALTTATQISSVLASLVVAWSISTR